MTSTTFDANELTLKPLTRPDRPHFVVDPPAIAPKPLADATPFAANTAIYDKIHRREKRPIAMLVGGAAVILTVAVLVATSGHKRATIGETLAAPPAATEPAMTAPVTPAPIAETAMTPASPAPAAPVPAARVATQPARVAPAKVARVERAAPQARTVTASEAPAPTPTVVAPPPVAVAPAPTVVAPPPVIVTPTPIETPSDTPQ